MSATIEQIKELLTPIEQKIDKLPTKHDLSEASHRTFTAIKEHIDDSDFVKRAEFQDVVDELEDLKAELKGIKQSISVNQ